MRNDKKTHPSGKTYLLFLTDVSFLSDVFFTEKFQGNFQGWQETSS